MDAARKIEFTDTLPKDSSCGDGCFAAAGKLEHHIRDINISLDVSQLQYVELPVEPQTGVRPSRGGNAAYGEIKA